MAKIVEAENEAIPVEAENKTWYNPLKGYGLLHSPFLLRRSNHGAKEQKTPNSQTDHPANSRYCRLYPPVSTGQRSFWFNRESKTLDLGMGVPTSDAYYALLHRQRVQWKTL